MNTFKTIITLHIRLAYTTCDLYGGTPELALPRWQIVLVRLQTLNWTIRISVVKSYLAQLELSIRVENIRAFTYADSECNMLKF